MKTLSLIVLAAVSFGALALSGCSGCSQEENTNTSTAVPQVTCGPGTRKVGNECVGTATSTANRAAPLNTTGNN